MNGFLNIYKPRGISSYDVIRHLKKQLGRMKIGHLGTLDPIAEGVLPVALGYATRVIEFTRNDKEYLATMKLGGISDTQDAWGTITPMKDQPVFSLNRLEEILPHFSGRIEQMPPMYSALHYQGKRLYELARQGITVPRALREVEISRLEIKHMELPPGQSPEIQLSIECSSGTYVRTLCHDIGMKLGTGAYMTGLIRIRSGDFTIASAVAPEKIDSSSVAHYILPLDFALTHLDTLVLDNPHDERLIMHGTPISMEQVNRETQAYVKIYDTRIRLVALGQIREKNRQPYIYPIKVFM